MKKFTQFISESRNIVEAVKANPHLKHLTHAEDHLLDAGSDGFEHAHEALLKAHEHTKGKKNTQDMTMKYDGSPSVVFGYHPDNGKFFVASKSAFNKTPKLNYTPEDVEKNHSHAPGLVKSLSHILEHLPKVTPKKGVFQGDLMYSPDTKQVSENGGVQFTPNVITYESKDPKDLKAKVGVVVHTRYTGKSDSMKAKFDPNLGSFKKHDDVNIKSAEHDTSKVNYSAEEQDKTEHELAMAKSIHDKHGKALYAHLDFPGQSEALNRYVNETVRTGESPSVAGLKSHIQTRTNKEMLKLKNNTAKAKRVYAQQNHLAHVDAHKENIENMFRVHKHLQNAKNVLVHALSRHDNGWKTSINGKKVKPEGFVFHHKGVPSKLVDREEFSKLNFEKVRGK